MQTFILVLVICAISMFGLAIGYLLAGKELKGSCGGPDGCDICADKDQCEDAHHHS